MLGVKGLEPSVHVMNAYSLNRAFLPFKGRNAGGCALYNESIQVVDELKGKEGKVGKLELKDNHPYSNIGGFLLGNTQERRATLFIGLQIRYGFDSVEYGLDSFRVQLGLVLKKVWLGSEYGFDILLVENASENHIQNSARTATWITQKC